jgi:hypothetical protein
MASGGRKIKGNPLSGLIPENWQVQTFDSETHYTVEVRGTALSDSEWDGMLELFKSEFGDNLYEVYSDIANGELFNVYLKNSADL